MASNAALLVALVLAAALAQGALGVGSSLRRSSSHQRAQRLGAASESSTGLLATQRSHASLASGVRSLALAAQGKPVRIARGGTRRRRTTDAKSHMGHAKCGVTSKVVSTTDKWEDCPAACPLYVQDRTDSDFCTFACVTPLECRQFYWATPIPDDDKGICRSCMVDGCEVCNFNVTEDRCAECQAGFVLEEDGQCHFKYAGKWMYTVGCILCAIVALVLLWIIDMVIRPTANPNGLQHGLDFRENTKLRQKPDASGERALWPLTTNMCTTSVAGPGMMLHFNFQVALIIWAVFVGCVWICFCHFADPALWILGSRRFGTPRSNCHLVAWGFATASRLAWTKVMFLWIVYIASFLLAMAYGVYQLRVFQQADFSHKTMKDYVAMVVGLPPVRGSKHVEEDLKAVIERVSGVTVIGISVAWDYQEHDGAVHKALHEDLLEAEAKEQSGSPKASREPPDLGLLRRKCYEAERTLFGLPDGEVGAEESQEHHAMKALLDEMQSSPSAFAVFETEAGRDEAVLKAEGGFAYEGREGIVLHKFEAEPDTVQWVNFGHSSATEQFTKLITGFGIISLACLFWGVVFYAPYAYYVLTFNYANGRQPGAIVGFSFSMIVVIGNAIMYEVCARISDWVGFRFKDEREACYMILYTVACMFNVGLDFVTTYFTAEKVMEGLGFRTELGVPLQEVTLFTAKFETYGMQRSLAENTFNYAFPSSYLIPFLIEPIVTVVLPLVIGRLIIKNHPEVQGRDAEEWVAAVPMEMGRYADLLLNTILAILIFYFPGGYTWILFFGMAGSHAYIYLWDHYRVLRSTPACIFASYDVEYCAQALMAPIIGIVPACLVMKSNCMRGYHCIDVWDPNNKLILCCCLAWAAHVALHLAALKYVVPLFGKSPPEDEGASTSYKDLASKVPCSWFTSNPVNCLRSKYKYGHSPSCSFYVLGKERFMNVNQEIGCFFAGDKGKEA